MLFHQVFPGDSVVKNPSANTGDVGLILIWEDVECPEQLSRCATATDAYML